MDVQFAGPELDSWQTAEVNRYSDKFGKNHGYIDVLHVEVKEHKKAGGRSSYTTTLRAEVRNDVLGAVEVTDWDFHMSLKGAFIKLAKELEHQVERKP